MNICSSNNHGEIVYKDSHCPACRRIEMLETKLDGLQKEVKNLDGVMIRFTFPENTIPYGQDFGVHIGIPAGIRFEMQRVSNNLIKLITKGYGQLTPGGQYGNGALYVSISRIPYHLRQCVLKAFERENIQATEDHHDTTP